MDALHRFILAGGYPPITLNGDAGFRRARFSSYRTTYVERDVREIQAIHNLSDFNRLLTLAAARTGQIANLSELGRGVGLPYATLRRYLQILEQTYQMYFISPYFSNIGKRLTKAPKLYWTDTGMACALEGIDSWEELEKLHRAGAMLETWVASELRKALTLSDGPISLHTWRIEQGPEVDFLLAQGTDLIAVEVKSAGRIRPETVQNMETLKEDLGESLRLGMILYGGTEFVRLKPWLAAVPLGRLFMGR